MINQCKHGQLARSCELCEIQRENAELKKLIEDSNKQKPVAFLNLSVWKRAGHDKVYATPEIAFDNQDSLYASPVIQGGMVSVPIEPTEKMLKVADKIDWSDSDTFGNYHNLWNAMIEASKEK